MPKELWDLFLEYRSVFSTTLTKECCMNCEPVKISLREGEAPPSPNYRSKPTPYNWITRTKEILKDLEAQGIIVQTQKASDFCSPSFCVPKQNDPSEPRLVVDFTKINEKIKRPFHPMQSVAEAWRGVPKGMKWFATLDLSASYC